MCGANARCGLRGQSSQNIATYSLSNAPQFFRTSQDDLCETSRRHNRISVYNVWGLTEIITILVDHNTGLIFIRMILSRFVKTVLCALVATCGVSVLGFAQDFSLTVEATPAVTEGMTQYRFYVNMNDASDRMSAVFGNNELMLSVDAPDGAFNSPFNSSWNASGINPAFVPVFPDLVDDTYATVGLEGPASSSGLEGAADPSIVEDSNQPITPFFLNDGATTLLSNTLTGASWYILNTASNGLPDADLRVLLMQVTSSGNVSGQMNFQVFPLGIGADQQQLSVAFDGPGTFGGGDEAVLGCTDAMACNYNAEATEDDGSCEFASCVVFGCTDELACNYDAAATEEDGSCDYCSCQRAATPYTLVVEGAPAVVAGMTTYRFYVTLPDEGDRFSAVFGNNDSNLEVSAPDGAYNSAFNSSWNASGINPAFLPAFPELAADTYATVGLAGPASTSGQAGAADPSIVEDADQMITPFFLTDGATLMESNTLTGSSWYVLNTASNGLANDDNRVLIMQVTTAGNVSGQISYQVFPLGVGSDQQQLSVAFDGEGIFGGDEPTVACGCTDDSASNFDPEATYDDGSCVFDVLGCTDSFACNYDDAATQDDGSCVYCDCGGDDAPAYTLSVEASAAVQPGAMTYRFYVNMVNATDKLSAVYGNNEEALSIQAPAGIYNSELNTSWNASGLAAAFVDLYPEMADDSYATIGLTGPASEAALGSVNPDLAESVEMPLTIAEFFTTGGADLDISDAVGGIWYLAGPATNANAGEEGRVLVMQITTEGDLLGTLNAQIFPEGDGQQEFKMSWTFSGTGTYDADGFGNACGCTDAEAINYNPAADYDDGSCVFGVAGCTDATACNYEEEATLDDGSCVFPAPGLNCDGTCVNDVDGDGICDENEVLGCTNPEALNYDEAATDDDGSCEVLGCTYALANNYNEAATDDDGSCEFDLTGSSCPGDLDGSGLVQLNDLLDFLLVYGTYCDE